MSPLQKSMNEFREMLEIDTLPQAYRGLMHFLLGLRNHLNQKYTERFSVSNFYQGFMNMS